MNNKRVIILTIIYTAIISTIAYSNSLIYPDEIEKELSMPHKTLDQLLKELREERKIIEQKRLEEIKMKRLQKELSKEDKIEEDINNNIPLVDKENIKEEQIKIPKLIVRLRGKHSLKYLCEYDFTVKDEYGESKVSKTIIEDYSTLLNNVSLKVRANEYINFEFDDTPENMKVYYAESGEEFKIKRNSISVPDLDERVVLIVEGIYENGYIKYAILLDIRKP